MADAAPPQQDNFDEVTGRWVLISTIMASAAGFIGGSALNVALPALQNSLEATAADLLWITNGYLLLLASLILVGGSLGDHYGRKRIFGYGIWLFTIGSALCGISPNVELLIASRLVQGIGGAMMIPGSLAIISAYFPDDRRGAAIGLWSSFTAATTVGGPIIGGVLADADLWANVLPQAIANETWRGVFFINVPLAALALYGLYAHVPESRDEEAPTQLDYPGAVLASMGLGGLSYGFIQAGEVGFNPVNIGVLLGGLVLLGVFVWWESHTDHPMMPLRLFKSPVFSGTNALTLFLYAGLQGALFFMPLNLIQAQDYPETIAGTALLPFSILLILMSRQSGAIADRIGPRIPLTVGPIVTGIGFAMLAIPGLTEGASQYWTTYFPGVLVIGLGVGTFVAPLTSAVMGSVPQHQSGTASGINNAASRTAGVLAIAIIGAVVLIQFNGTLAERLSTIDLTEENNAALMAQASELGNVQVPDTVPEEQTEAVQRAVKLAFVDVFRTSVLIGAVLAWISAGFAWFTLRMRPEEAREMVEASPVPEPTGD
ncbi:MAG: MFS transporter [Chloroflexota bacterium]